MMGISQTVLIIGLILTPFSVESMMTSVGFRKTLWVLTALESLTFVTVSVLQPVEWHMKKVILEENLDETCKCIEKRKFKYFFAVCSMKTDSVSLEGDV